MKYLLFALIIFSFFRCTKTEFKEPLEYTGPLQEAENIELFNSENEHVKSKLTAPLFYEFENGDKEFPEGVNIENYDVSGRLESTLRANYAKYVKKENHYRGEGNVELKNMVTNEQLNTEELFFNPVTDKIYTTKFVTIKTQGDVIYGTGLDAKRDLSDYVITSPTGTIGVSE
jgi:LPS export ABC transporter protein LptC